MDLKKILPLLLALSGCASVPQQLDQNIFYKRDMTLDVNGFQAEGALVVPRGTSYKFKIDAKGRLDLFTFETCHREESKENAGEGGLFGDRKHVEMEYIPNEGMEDRGSCVVRLGGYERDKGRHSWAIIDFEDPDTTLPALVRCNGSTWNSNGVTVCQSKEGLLQGMDFTVPVVVSGSCAVPGANDEMIFRYSMPSRECVYEFMEKAEPHRTHRLTTIGYQSVLVREN